MFRTTHIRTKLAVALAVPIAALVAVAGFEVLDAKADVDRAESQAGLAQSAIGPGSVVVQLQDERNLAYVSLIDLGSADRAPAASFQDQRDLTDAAALEFRRETDSRGSGVGEAFGPAWKAVGGLAQVRTDIDGFGDAGRDEKNAFADNVFQRYTDIIDAFFQGTTQVALSVDDSALRRGATVVDAATRQTELQTRLVRTLVQATASGDLDEPVVRQEVAALFDRLQQNDTAIRANSTGTLAGVGNETFTDPSVAGFNEQVAAYLAGEDVKVAPMLGALAADPATGYAGLRTRAAKVLATDATQMQDDAVARQKLFGGIALAGLLLTLLVSWFASRSITRPLRSLKSQAKDMAGSRLPAAVRQILDTPSGEDVVIPAVAPIKVKTRDEVAEVAAALSEVQASALELAVEQAVLRRNIADSYINLGRRNQNLLSRQLDFITELEREETDPDGLEGLFRLDHLATRMRRNAESLLVLAGIEPPRQWSAPARVVDVVRAALGEVEDYQRVVVAHLEPASITGAVASEIAHVLAELIENALSFSPPDMPVEVNGRLTTSGYALSIADNGFGMSQDEVQRANRRLAGKESYTVAPSRYLGHYVAGHLASRLGVAVVLEPREGGGITANVTVPLGLVADDEFDAKLAKERAVEPDAAPITAGPTAAVVSTETTASGLPRRGDRTPAPAPAPAPTRAPAPAAAPAPVEPLVTGAPVAPPAPLSQPEPAVAELSGVPLSPGKSMFSVAADQARTANGNGSGNGHRNGHHRHDGHPSGATSASSAGAPALSRRVPGAQRPDAPVVMRGQEATPTEPGRSSPEDVYTFLSSFQSGVDRGRADAPGQIASELQEDGR